MADFATLFASVLDGAAKAIDDSERRALMAQVNAIKALSPNAAATVDDVLKAFAAGWAPDFFAGDQLDVSAQLAITDAVERTFSAGGNATFAGFGFNASFAETFRQGTQTNLSVTCRLIRQSRGKGIEHALTELGNGLPTPLPATAPLPAATTPHA